jgi:hypothetical protein
MTKPTPRLSRAQLLAAEIFGYSYADYQDHLGIGNIRYERLMPERVETLERAARETWPVGRLAKKMDASEEDATDLLDGYHQAVNVVDAGNAAASFRNAVRNVVKHAITKGLTTEESVEALVRQVCFRAADLAYLLDVEDKPLSRYSRHLRREPDVEYSEDYFDEDGA